MNFQAHNDIDVRNWQLQKLAQDFVEEGRLTPPQYEALKEAFPTKIQQPNIFLRIGLFVFTSLCILFSMFFIGLLTGSLGSSMGAWGGLALFFAVVLTAMVEFFIREKHWYQQGSDNAMVYAAVGCFITAIGMIVKFDSALSYSVVSLIFLTVAAWHYGDALLAFGAFYSLILSFIIGFDTSETPPIVVPFACAVLAFTVYFLSKTALKNADLFYWEDSFRILEIASLAVLYGACNYYMVDTFLKDISDLVGIPSPYNYLFAFLTVFIPLMYVIIGVQNKKRILWILGSIGIVLSILTYRHYYAVMPIEWALTLAGIASLLLAFFLLKYLKIPQNGFTYLSKSSKTNFLESIIVNQFIQQNAAPDDTVRFGGGDFGGGGASESF